MEKQYSSWHVDAIRSEYGKIQTDKRKNEALRKLLEHSFKCRNGKIQECLLMDDDRVILIYDTGEVRETKAKFNLMKTKVSISEIPWDLDEGFELSRVSRRPASPIRQKEKDALKDWAAEKEIELVHADENYVTIKNGERIFIGKATFKDDLPGGRPRVTSYRYFSDGETHQIGGSKEPRKSKEDYEKQVANMVDEVEHEIIRAHTEAMMDGEATLDVAFALGLSDEEYLDKFSAKAHEKAWKSVLGEYFDEVSSISPSKFRVKIKEIGE